MVLGRISTTLVLLLLNAHIFYFESVFSPLENFNRHESQPSMVVNLVQPGPKGVPAWCLHDQFELYRGSGEASGSFQSELSLKSNGVLLVPCKFERRQSRRPRPPWLGPALPCSCGTAHCRHCLVQGGNSVVSFNVQGKLFYFHA